MELTFLLEGLAEIAGLRAFHRARRGMAEGFWAPSWAHEFRLVENAAAAAGTIVVERTLLDDATSLAQHGYLVVVAPWESGDAPDLWPVAIADVAVDGDIETVELAAALPFALERGRHRVMPLLYVRFASDELEFEYVTDAMARVRIGVTELPEEYPQAGGAVAPIEELWLYQFRIGGPYGTSARFAGWGEPVIAGGLDWLPADIAHDAIAEDVELTDSVTIELASGDPAHFLRRRHLAPVAVEIYQYRPGIDPSPVLHYAGAVESVDLEQRARMRVRCASRAGWDREVPAIMYQRLDNHALFSPGNGLRREDWIVTGTVSDVGPRYIESTAVGVKVTETGDAQWFVGGIVRVAGEQRVVVGIDGDRLWLADSFDAVAVGDAVHMSAGYDRRVQTAADRFGNAANFLGFPLMTSKHPAVEQMEQTRRSGKKG